MDNLTKADRQEIMDTLGKLVIEQIRDGALQYSMDIAKYRTVNQVKLKQYKSLSSLAQDQQEAVCDLLSETITNTIYRFLEMFEDYKEEIKLMIHKDKQEYNVVDISEKMGSEIACFEDDGWIQKFSKIGRFV